MIMDSFSSFDEAKPRHGASPVQRSTRLISLLSIPLIVTACHLTVTPSTQAPVVTPRGTDIAPTQYLIPVGTGIFAPASFTSPELVDAARNSLPALNGRIAFDAGPYGGAQIYLADLNSWTITQLTNARGNSFDSDWSPDGKKMAFRTDRNGQPPFTSLESGEIYVMNADGTQQTNLTNNPANDGWPKWSPDGSQIVFASYRDGRTNTEIYIMNADGSGATQLTDTPALNNEDVAWSPDGKKIAFKSYRDGDWEIYVMNRDGTAQTRLTHSRGEDGWPAWSPDGKQIAFLSQRDSQGNLDITAIYAMNFDGSGQKPLTQAGGFSSPAWSPDGSKIAFYYDLYPGGSSPGIYVMNADGSGMTQLISGDGGDPAWH
jgi:Tol biopolymer transport system component